MIEILGSAPIWILVLTFPFKVWASWEAAQRNQFGWFILFFLTWLYAIPEIVYLVWFKKTRW